MPLEQLHLLHIGGEKLPWRQRNGAEQHHEIEPETLEIEAAEEIIEADKAMPIAEWRGILTLVGVDVPGLITLRKQNATRAFRG